MIIHKKHRVKFTQIATELLEDERLTWKAKGILSYLLSKPQDWDVQVPDLITRSTDGEASVRSALRELRQLHYARLENIRRGGKIIQRRLTIDEYGNLPEDTLLDRDFLNLENLNEENRHISNTKVSNTEKKITAQPVISKADAIAYSKEIGLPPIEVDKFFDHFTANGWRVGSARMRDPKAAMRNWKRNVDQWQKPRGRLLPAEQQRKSEHDARIERDMAETRERLKRKGLIK